MAGEHEIEALMDTAMKSLRELVDVNTIIGDIIESNDGVTVIPVSRVCCGFLAGGGECGKSKDTPPFVGGSGAGSQGHRGEADLYLCRSWTAADA